MTIFFLVVGGVIGAVSVVFILQNDAMVTVSFYDWQIDGPLAAVLMFAMGTGILVTILFLLPSLITAEFRLAKLRRQNAKLEEDLSAGRDIRKETEVIAVVEREGTPPPAAS